MSAVDIPSLPFGQLVVLSHLRWDGVWQRPQHLISRLGAECPTVVVEEPKTAPTIDVAGWTSDRRGGVERLWWQQPGATAHAGFDSPLAAHYASSLPSELAPGAPRVVWLYTALALPAAISLAPDLLVYDVMDDLGSFKGASPAHASFHRRAIQAADLVFTGGRTLHDGVSAHRTADVHCFPSGVEIEHFTGAARARTASSRERPVAGYVGVVDERMDLALVGALADQLRDWDIQMVGPVIKIDERSLPVRPNLHWMGPRAYADLPSVLSDFDVALMPFALNEATRSISPTKTLEYLAAGLPVVSTSVPDVVADYARIVHLADGEQAFADACRRAILDRNALRRVATERALKRQHWDTIASRMRSLMDAKLSASPLLTSAGGMGL